jgi:hypothetical protein
MLCTHIGQKPPEPSARRGGKRKPPKVWIADDKAVDDEEDEAEFAASDEEEEMESNEEEDEDEKIVLEDDDDEGGAVNDDDLDAAVPVRSSKKPRALRAMEGVEGAVSALNAFVVKCIDKAKREPEAGYFLDAVPPEVPGYYEEIKQPTDLGMMRTRASKNGYWNVAEFYADLSLMLDNCRLYNNETRPENFMVVQMCEALVPKVQGKLIDDGCCSRALPSTGQEHPD